MKKIRIELRCRHGLRKFLHDLLLVLCVSQEIAIVRNRKVQAAKAKTENAKVLQVMEATIKRRVMVLVQRNVKLHLKVEYRYSVSSWSKKPLYYYKKFMKKKFDVPGTLHLESKVWYICR